MTQTADKPISLTYDKLHEKFQTAFPQLLPPLELIKPKLDRGEGAQDLANIISCEVTQTEEPTAFVYTWTGQKGQAFECRVLRPFELIPSPTPTATEIPGGAIKEASSDAPDVAQTGAQAPSEVRDTPEPTAEPERQPEPVDTEPQPPSPSPGLFTALADLIGSNTLLMTIARHDDELTVNVMPFGDDKESSISAICITATPTELDEGFTEVTRVKVEGRKSLAEQVEALKEAEKVLAEAKKAEADAKKAEGDKKKKATEDKKKEDEKKKAEEAREAEKAKAQEALF